MTGVYAAGDVLLDRYRIEAPLAAGAMGAVYVARQLSVDRRVAIKALHPGKMWDEKAIARFRREAEALARLNHPHIVHLYEFALDPRTRTPVLISELVQGRSLLDVLREEGKLPLSRTTRLLAQVADALAYAHREQIIHRDLKPANIMVTGTPGGPDEAVKILDFGLAKLTDDDNVVSMKLTAPGAFVGTVGFASPEQMLGDPVDEKSDLYSLGCLLFACLEARAPVLGANTKEAAKKQLAEPAPLLSDVDIAGTPIPPEIDALYRAMLERNPKNRPQGARAVAAVLAGEARELGDPTELITRLTAKPRAAEPPRSRVPWAIGFGVLVLAAIGVISFAAPSKLEAPEPPLRAENKPAAVALPASDASVPVVVALPAPTDAGEPDSAVRSIVRRIRPAAKVDAGTPSAYPVW